MLCINLCHWKKFVSRQSVAHTPRQKKQKLCLNKLKKQEVAKAVKYSLKKRYLRYMHCFPLFLSPFLQVPLFSSLVPILSTSSVTCLYSEDLPWKVIGDSKGEGCVHVWRRGGGGGREVLQSYIFKEEYEAKLELLEGGGGCMDAVLWNNLL